MPSQHLKDLMCALIQGRGSMCALCTWNTTVGFHMTEVSGGLYLHYQRFLSHVQSDGVMFA